MQPTPPSSGERWNVNMPAVIGVVFVFLVGVVIWVVASSGGDDDAAPVGGPATSGVATSDPPAPTDESVPPSAGDDAVPGDLGVPGRAMQRPPCDGSFITVLASPIGDQATADSVAAVLEQYPGSNYLRTDQTCSSLSQSSDGRPVYVIFLGPFAFDSDACAARAEGPADAYARRLSNDVGPGHSVDCA